MRIIIVGGVAGGASAATRARRVNSKAEIIIYEKGPNISFANCGLPYHLGNEIKERSKLLVTTPELFKKRFDIQVKTEHEVLDIDTENKTLTVVNHRNNEKFKDSYDRLILSTGSKLIELPEIPYRAQNVFTLWSLADLDSIKSYIDKNESRHATVIGAGFVGLEVVEQLHRIGVQVQLIELAPQVLNPLDPEMASFILDELKKHTVSVHTSSKVDAVKENKDRVSHLRLSSSNNWIETDLIIVGVGVKPLNLLALKADLNVSKQGAVCVNEQGQTSDPDIYAVGDLAETIFSPTDSAVSIPLAGPANRAGRIAGEHAAANTNQFTQKVNATSIVRVFNKAAGSTGLSEKLCKRENVPYRLAYASAPHHASYFPGAKELIIKLLYAPNTGIVLGAQVIGEEGVDKRLDILSTLIHFKGTVYDLAALDFAYAPPFGSAKDLLHQVAFVAMNDLAKAPELLRPDAELSGLQVVDVRTNVERETLPLDEAIHLPLDGNTCFYEHPLLKELDYKKETIVVCHAGKRAHIVASYLKGIGFEEVKNLSGGMMIRSRFIKN